MFRAGKPFVPSPKGCLCSRFNSATITRASLREFLKDPISNIYLDEGTTYRSQPPVISVNGNHRASKVGIPRFVDFSSLA
jgi:hypothetical protein